MHKILVVDDEKSVRMLMRNLLEKEEYEVIEAVNGKEAVQAFRSALEEKEPYDLVCLDVMMPELDGQAVLRVTRRLEQEVGTRISDWVKIIMTTSLDDKKNVMEAIQSQVDAYIIKPVDKEKLIEKMQSLGLLD